MLEVIIYGVVMLIFGSIITYLGFNTFNDSWLELPYLIAKYLMLIFGLAYCISSVFIFALKNWARKLAIYCSIVLLLFFVPLVIFFIVSELFSSLSHSVQASSCGGWGYLFAVIFSPLIIVPLMFVDFFNRPKVKEQFKQN